MLDILPSELVGEIQVHLRTGCEHAEDGWESGQADEDTLTGDLGASLRRGWQSVVAGNGSSWRWRLKYTKFRGRGRNAEEKIIGADGIFQVEVENLATSEMHNKGLLFQAKKYNDRHKQQLLGQANAMTELVPNGAAIFEYGPASYRGYDARDVENDVASARKNETKGRLGDFLAAEFLPCNIGLRGMYYESSRLTLFIPASSRGFRRIRTRLKHGFRIEVQRKT